MIRKISSRNWEIWGGAFIRAGALIMANTVCVIIEKRQSNITHAEHIKYNENNRIFSLKYKIKLTLHWFYSVYSPCFSRTVMMKMEVCWLAGGLMSTPRTALNPGCGLAVWPSSKNSWKPKRLFDLVNAGSSLDLWLHVRKSFSVSHFVCIRNPLKLQTYILKKTGKLSYSWGIWMWSVCIIFLASRVLISVNMVINITWDSGTTVF